MSHDLQADLLAAIVDEQPGAIEVAIMNGADPNAALPNEKFAVPVAIAFRASPRVIQTLLDNGADPDQAAADGTPALVAAVETGNGDSNLEIVRALLEAGAAVATTPSKGAALITQAQESGSPSTAELLKAALDAERQAT